MDLSSYERDLFTRPTPYIDSDSAAVEEHATRETAGAADDVDKAVRLFYAVRDGIRYDLLGETAIAREGFAASAVLKKGSGFCIHKAVLLAAVCRAIGLPCRLRFADVRNHLTTPELQAIMQTDVFIWHGLVDIWLEDRWVKATPAFDRGLCERHGVRPIEFDGTTDAVFHEFDVASNKHMEYVKDRGWFSDLPYDEILADFRATYPQVYAATR